MGIEPVPAPYWLLDQAKTPAERRRVFMRVRSGMMDQARMAGCEPNPWPVGRLLADCANEAERKEVRNFIAKDDARRLADVPQGWAPSWGAIAACAAILAFAVGWMVL